MEEGNESFVINIPGCSKYGMAVPTNLGNYHLSTTRSFESIIGQIQKIHTHFKPFIWLHYDPLDQNILTVRCLHMSYRIYIYVDLESDMYIIDLVNINMLDDIFFRVWNEMKIRL